MTTQACGSNNFMDGSSEVDCTCAAASTSHYHCINPLKGPTWPAKCLSSVNFWLKQLRTSRRNQVTPQSILLFTLNMFCCLSYLPETWLHHPNRDIILPTSSAVDSLIFSACVLCWKCKTLYDDLHKMWDPSNACMLRLWCWCCPFPQQISTSIITMCVDMCDVMWFQHSFKKKKRQVHFIILKSIIAEELKPGFLLISLLTFSLETAEI